MLINCGDKSAPKKEISITQHSDVYYEAGNWHCPICGGVVTNQDRSDIPSELLLSEWHDVFLTKDYFKDKIGDISDEELFSSIDFTKPELAHIKKLVQDELYNRAAQELTSVYHRAEAQKILYSCPGENSLSYKPFDEFLDQLKNDTARKNEIIRSALEVAHPDKGYTINGVHFGKSVDFNKNVDEGWKFGAVNFAYGLNLLCAYFLTDDSFYLHSLEDLINQLYAFRMKMTQSTRYNPIWYELGIAGRITRMVDIYRIAGHKFSAQTQKNLLKFLLGQARWLHQSLVRVPFHYYNWQTANATALGYTALRFPEFAESATWLADSKRYMKWHFENSFYPDGGHSERTPGYAKYAFSMFYRYILLLKHFMDDESWAKAYWKTLEKMVQFYALTHSPIATSCPFNDARRDKTQFIQFFTEMAQVFQRGDFLAPIADYLPEDSCPTKPVKLRIPDILSFNFESSQYAVMRENWNSDSYFMLINYGPFRNHAHYDALDFEIYANGIPIAVDAGLGPKAYTDSLHVDWYKQPQSHNMLIIDDAIPDKRRAGGKDVVWISQHLTDYFAATHEGYKDLNGSIHRRHVIFIKGKYWLIFDQIKTSTPGIALSWNLHSPLHFQEMGNGFISTGQNGALIASVPDTSLKRRIEKGIA
ncbi:alginate lyase family protein, partial [candidate division KSB1 bacterium]|nr:alginate lyase family protein [candidate division KSB1 bacterium]